MTEPSQVSPMEFDVAIVGGGLVGSALALALAELPLSVAIIESQSQEGQKRQPVAVRDVANVDARVSAITEASRRFLSDLNAWDRLLAGRVEAYRQMVVWDGEGTGEIVFHADDLQVPQLGHILENQVLVRALLEALEDQERVTVLDLVRVKGWQSQNGAGLLQLDDGRAVRAALVVGADGARSKVRHWAGLPVREWDYQQQAIVCTVRTEFSHRHSAWQRFTRAGPLAFLPLAVESGDDHYVSIVWSQDTAEADRLMELEDSAFCVALERALESRLGRIESASRRQALALRQCHAKRYTAAGVALVGDAAHSIHPLAGQGVNLGFADAAVLADEIRRGVVRGLTPGDLSVLGRYERRRKGDNLAMMAGMEGFKRLFGRDDLPVRWLRNAGLRWVNHQGMLKQWLAAEAMGLHKGLPRFSSSPIIRRSATPGSFNY